MSTGQRMPLWKGQEAARYLMKQWGMTEPACMVVGSVRRERPDIGDVELIAPAAADKNADPIFDAMDRTIDTPGLFGERKTPFCRPIRGFKRGFMACSLVADLVGEDGFTYQIPVQVFRYAHDGANRGWTELRCTGPGDFGRQVLIYWKKRFGIHHDQKASIDDHLVDSLGNRVQTPTERSVFERLRIDYIEPKHRDAWIADLLRAQTLNRREVFR